MTTPTSSLGMSHIQTEFGGSNPISLSEYYGVNANVAGSGQISMSQFLGITALGASLPADLSHDSFAIAPSDASISLYFYTNGQYALKDGSSNVANGSWITSGSASQFDIRLNKTSGETPWGHSVNTWHNVTSTVSWGITEGTDNYASTSFAGSVEIRMAASPYTVFDSASTNWSATVEV